MSERTATPFSVATWNVLAHAYSFSHRGVPKAALAWPDRAERILRAIDAAGRPGVLCLQELDEFDACEGCDSSANFRSKLESLGYECRYTPRNGAYSTLACDPAPDVEWCARSLSKRHKRDGVLIAWQRDQFELDGGGADTADGNTMTAVHRVDFDDLAYAESEVQLQMQAQGQAQSTAGGGGGVDATSMVPVQPDTRFLRHNAGMFVFLRPRRGATRDAASAASASSASGPVVRPLLVACMHLYWNPLYEEVKLRQLHYLLARMRGECARRLSTTMDALNHHLASTHLQPAATATTTSTAPLDPLSQFPLIVCGDLNSSPLSSVYHVMTGGDATERSDAAAAAAAAADGAALPSDEPVAVGGVSGSPSDPSVSTSSSSASSSLLPRFLCDSDLSKVAKWLRSIGVDCALFTGAERNALSRASPSSSSPPPRPPHVALFERALREDRILLARSSKLVERRGCPPRWFLLPPRVRELEQAFGIIVRHFALGFREDLFYSRCIFCNSDFETIEAEHFTGGTDRHGVTHQAHPPPPDLPSGFVARGYRDDDGTKLTFQRCKNEDPLYNPCGKLFWWGARSDEAVRKFRGKFEQILREQHEEQEEEQEQDDAHAAHPSPSSSLSSSAGGANTATATVVAEKRVATPLSPERLSQLQLAARIVLMDPSRNHNANAQVNANGDVHGNGGCKLPTSSSSSSSSDDSPPPDLYAPHRVLDGRASLNLRSAYAMCQGAEPPFTNVTDTFADCLDYIFVSSNSSSSSSSTGSTASTGAGQARGAAAATVESTLRVDSVRPVTDQSGLDVDQMHKEIGGAGTGQRMPSTTAHKHQASCIPAPAAATATARAVPALVQDAAWRPMIPAGHTAYTWGLHGQPPEARVAGIGANPNPPVEHVAVDTEAAPSAAVPAATTAIAPSVTVGAPAAPPLCTVLPNLVWPSDHLMLLAHCTLTTHA